MPPRPLSRAIEPSLFDLAGPWLLNRFVVMKRAGWPWQLIQIDQGLAHILEAEYRIKDMLSVRTWDSYVRRPYTRSVKVPTMEQQHVDVITHALGPARDIRDLLGAEASRFKHDHIQRHFDPSIELYREVFDPLINDHGSDMLHPDMLKAFPEHLGARVAQLREAFDHLKTRQASNDHRQHLKAARQALHKSFKSYDAYLDTITKRHPTLHVVYLGLGYLPDIGEVTENTIDHLTFERVINDFNLLMKWRRHHPLFKGLQGFIWKRDRDVSLRHMTHFLLFFDQNTLKHYPDIKERVCDFWINEITQGSGMCLDMAPSRPIHNVLSSAWLCPLRAQVNDKVITLDQQNDTYPQRLKELTNVVHALLNVDRLTRLEFPTGYPRVGRGQRQASS